MGKSLSWVPKLNEAKIVSSASSKPRKPPQKQQLRKSEVRVSTPQTSKPSSLRVHSAERVKPPSSSSTTTKTNMESGSLRERQNRVALAQVVSDCVNRWFQDTLKEAKAGDINMQVLVGQMYNSGYGVPRDPELGRAWINRASRNRSSAWKVSEKPPGYNASDSDSNGPKDDRK